MSNVALLRFGVDAQLEGIVSQVTIIYMPQEKCPCATLYLEIYHRLQDYSTFSSARLIFISVKRVLKELITVKELIKTGN